MVLSNIYKNLIILSLCTLITGCMGIEGWSKRSDYMFRKLTPRAKRTQFFTNTPTPYNQQREDEYEPEQVMRELRNGIRGYNQEHRMKQDAHLRKVTGTENSYGKGFHDGCKTFLSAVGAGPYRAMDTKFDADRMVEDSWYLRGFQDGSSFCTFRTDWEMH